jgi:hypothetical protein
VALTQRISKLEKKATDRSQTGNLEDRVVYQPNAKELEEALRILFECAAVREVVGSGSGVCWVSLGWCTNYVKSRQHSVRQRLSLAPKLHTCHPALQPVPVTEGP